MKVYAACRGDDDEYNIVGIFSKQDDVERFVELGVKIGDRLFWNEQEIDELVPLIAKLEDLDRYHLHIYHLDCYGTEYSYGTHWGAWNVHQSINVVMNYQADESIECLTSKEHGIWMRYAAIKAHTPREAMDIAEKIMVRL